MMNAKREKRIQPVATAALILGLLSLNPFSAFAAERQGLTLQELQTLTDSTFEASREGNQIKIAGSVPASCLEGATATYGVMDGDKHMITIDFPNCRDGRSKDPKEPKTASLSEAFIPGLPVNINTSKSGKFFIRHLNAGDPNAKRKPEPEELLDYQGNLITYETRADEAARLAQKAKEVKDAEQAKRDAERAEAQKAEEAKLEQKRLAAAKREAIRRSKIIDNIEDLCTKGDFVGLGLEIEKAGSFLGDVSALLDKATLVQKKRLEKEMKSAKDAESLRTAFEQFVAVSEEKGWDTDGATKSYVDRRIELVKDIIGEASAADAAAQVRELASDLKDVDRSTFKKNKSQIAWMYGEIATRSRNSGKHDEAEKYYQEAGKFADDAAKGKLEGEMAKMYMEDWKACVDKNKLKPGVCDKLANKAKAHAKSALALGKTSDEADGSDSAKAEYITTFGIESAPSVNVKGFGKMTLNPQGAGAMEQYKKQALAVGMQEAQAAQMQQLQLQMQQRMGGMGMTPNAMLNSPLGAGVPGAMGMAGGLNF